jgi:hypothetical protein
MMIEGLVSTQLHQSMSAADGAVLQFSSAAEDAYRWEHSSSWYVSSEAFFHTFLSVLCLSGGRLLLSSYADPNLFASDFLFPFFCGPFFNTQPLSCPWSPAYLRTPFLSCLGCVWLKLLSRELWLQLSISLIFVFFQN